MVDLLELEGTKADSFKSNRALQLIDEEKYKDALAEIKKNSSGRRFVLQYFVEKVAWNGATDYGCPKNPKGYQATEIAGSVLADCMDFIEKLFNEEMASSADENTLVVLLKTKADIARYLGLISKGQAVATMNQMSDECYKRSMNICQNWGPESIMRLSVVLCYADFLQHSMKDKDGAKNLLSKEIDYAKSNMRSRSKDIACILDLMNQKLASLK